MSKTKNLNTGDFTPEILAAKNHERAIIETRELASTIKWKISLGEEELHALLGGEDEALDAIQARREELLAEMALGFSVDQTLADIDRQLEELALDANGEHAAQVGQYRDVSQTLTGLRRKLVSVEARLVELESQSTAIVKAMIAAEAERVGADYLAAAESVRECFKRLHGLDALCREMTMGVEGFLYTGGYPLFLPAPRLRAVAGANGHDIANGVFFASDREATAGGLLRQRNIELDRLGIEGIETLFNEVFKSG
tara:strand:+ start:508 stop:1275 length:768 start_codon:yes stop_codon:yes gene_type:complete